MQNEKKKKYSLKKTPEKKILEKILKRLKVLNIKKDDVIVLGDMDEADHEDMNYFSDFLKKHGHDNLMIFMRSGDNVENINIAFLLSILDSKLKELGINIEKYKSIRLFKNLSQLYAVAMQAFKDLHASDGLFVCQKEYNKKFKLTHSSLNPLKEMLAMIANEFDNIEKGISEKDGKQ